MSSFNRLERRLPTLLEELGAPRTPDYFADILSRTASTKQRPRWFLERWLPVTELSRRLAFSPRVPWRAALAVGLLLVALVIGVLLAIGSRPRVPSPFGPAANGLIAFADTDGAIRVANPLDGSSKVLIAGPDNERPVFSPDGRELAYLHRAAVGTLTIMVAAADGRSPRAMGTDAYAKVGHLGWSPDGSRVVAAVSPNRLLAFDVAAAGPPTLISDKIRAPGTFGALDAFNAGLASLFRPPAGDEVAFIGTGSDGSGLYRQAISGGNPVALLTTRHESVPFGDLASPQWSPDGTRIAVTVLAPNTNNDWRVYVMNADGSGIRRLTHLVLPDTVVSEAWPAWSPDGTRVAMMRWFDHGPDQIDVRPITIVDVATGAEKEVGDVAVNGHLGWGWSPDGSSILETPDTPSPDAHRLVVVDAMTGAVTRTDFASDFAPTWQRTAP